jgi:hypothetical protein
VFEFFLPEVHYRIAENGCWVWLRGRKGKEAKKGGGYPCWRINGRVYGVHRLACEYRHGPLAADLHARHTCHNTLCVNPQHLIPGTSQENARDSAVALRRPHKLSVEAILDIKRSCAAGELQRIVAVRHGLRQGDVSHIVNGHYWSHVTT